jgi:UDPglucose--hexose-1-phosphate uridylyltransferase
MATMMAFIIYDRADLKNFTNLYDRYRDLRRDRRFRSFCCSKAWISRRASLDHPHSQLIATPIIPKTGQWKRSREQSATITTKNVAFSADIIRQELSSGERIVHENEQFVAFAPFASRFPFETWIAPKEHRDSFGDIESNEIEALASIMHSTLRKLITTLDNPPFNYIIHTSPCDEHCTDYFHWQQLKLCRDLPSVAGLNEGIWLLHQPGRSRTGS